MSKECELCVKRKTMYCPNSSKCYSTEEKPFYQNRIMLLDENQQLKLTNQALSGCLKIDKEKIDYYVDRCEQLEKVLDEIREYIESNKREASSHFNGKEYVFINYWLECDPNDLLQILDKVKE